MSNGRPIMLVLRALGLGDLLTTVPALRALTRAFPGHRRVLATTPALAPLALRAELADDVLPVHALRPLAWRDCRPAMAVDLQGPGPESHRVLLDTHPAQLIAFSHPLVPQSWHGPAWREGEHEVRRWCRLLEESGVAADATDLDVQLPPRPLPVEAIGATVLHPGAASGARRWPAERWVELARAESANDRVVLLTGNAAERPLAVAIARRAGLRPSAVWAGRTDVLTLAAFVRRADRVVCGDTGVAHLATAFRTPSVVLFGPTPPSEWGPPNYQPSHRVLWTGRCGDRHGLKPHAGLLEIRVEDVVTALDSLPSATRRESLDAPARPWSPRAPLARMYAVRDARGANDR